MTALTVPGGHSVADTEYEVHAGATKVDITLFDHTQDPATCKFTNQVAVLTPTDGSTLASHGAYLTLSGKVLSIESFDTSLNSIEIPLEYKATVAANSGTITSATFTFKILMWQRACSTTYTNADVTYPNYGTNQPGSAINSDGNSVVLELADYEVRSTNIYEQAASFGLLCGPRADLTMASGSPSWVTLSGSAFTYALQAAPYGVS